ncbi:MAG: radical SAM protein [Deltaproteobacteria bacterium]|nr:radical SAM protein [Deltaproteobacteria bacterium]MBZ0220268.1 radical SAM protein [Deltaproteobacteria bacterium]
MLSVSGILSGKTSGSSRTERLRYSRESRPVVVWNLTRSCTLSCLHCYNDSRDRAFDGELSTAEAVSVIDSLSVFGVPAIVFSGGDPLTRDDIFHLAGYAGSKRIRTILSTSGVLIDEPAAKRIKKAGFSYAGVSIDGSEETNDRLRGSKGSFKKALDGIRCLKGLDIPTGVRITLSRNNAGELPFIFDLIEKEGLERGYFAHLVYSGRGGAFSREDLGYAETRAALDYIFERAAGFIEKGVHKEIVTGSNDADGAYLYLKLRESDPEKAEAMRGLLSGRGGNTAGVNIACIDNLGRVHADQFWQGHPLGSVRERPFGEIWRGPEPLLNALRDRKAFIKGRCNWCSFFDICGGNSRARAASAYGDFWAEDPACYLTDEEIGIKLEN